MEHRSRAWHWVPDAVSRGQVIEVEIASVGAINDNWYLPKIEKVKSYPDRYESRRIDNGLLYVYRQDDLLDPINNQEKCWKRVLLAGGAA